MNNGVSQWFNIIISLLFYTRSLGGFTTAVIDTTSRNGDNSSVSVYEEPLVESHKRAQPLPVGMSTEAQKSEDELREEVTNFLRRNFPQIQMHGGSAAIQHLDVEAGEVTVALGGACSGCGISPMTIQAIKSRMVKEIPEINRVNAETGMGGMGGGGGGQTSPSFPGEMTDDDSDEGPQAPF